ncbi:bacteriophage abortive infection AbiH family protein [Dickeya zeae]|uniref:bacteriophage abortive infection AbiH family protein n=1 Tax=Dickeya zeae TaxID=204042 RepID=UPI00039BB5CB|nr:bacteriophage abortive infection AbiH family protein [Dickeya zeae]
MTMLYIIGNGFDLWHGLKTSYAQFNDFAKEELNKFSGFYSFDLNALNNDALWNDFENTLGTFDWREFYAVNNNIDVDAESFRPSFVYGLEDDLTEQAEQHVASIRECFEDWIESIDISIAKKKLYFSGSAQFITFNYTSTLEYIYGINDQKILHIHGRAKKFDELVFGHGETIKEEPELDENGDSNRTPFSNAEDAAKYPFYALQKPISSVLERHREFFDSLRDTQRIIVIGHSLNKIDLPYVKALVKTSSKAMWTVCLHDPKDESDHIQALVECGVSHEQIDICTYQDLESKNYHND